MIVCGSVPDSLNWSCGQLWDAMWVLGVEPRSSGKAAGVVCCY